MSNMANCNWALSKSSYLVATWTNSRGRRRPSDSHTLDLPELPNPSITYHKPEPLHIITEQSKKVEQRKKRMAQAMASMAAAAFMEGGHMSTARLPATSSVKPSLLTARAHHSSSLQCSASESTAATTQSSRRSLLGLLAATVSVAGVANKALAAATSIKVQGPPPPSGGLSGTKNSDEARDLDLPLKERFYIQPLKPTEAAARAKESAKEILNVKELISKKAWPYVQNDLRLRASYLRYDLNTVISAMPKDQKMPLKTLTNKLFDTLNNLDYAAREKSTPKAEKYYAETVSALNDVLAKLG